MKQLSIIILAIIVTTTILACEDKTVYTDPMEESVKASNIIVKLDDVFSTPDGRAAALVKTNGQKVEDTEPYSIVIIDKNGNYTQTDPIYMTAKEFYEIDNITAYKQVFFSSSGECFVSHHFSNLEYNEYTKLNNQGHVVYATTTSEIDYRNGDDDIIKYFHDLYTMVDNGDIAKLHFDIIRSPKVNNDEEKDNDEDDEDDDDEDDDDEDDNDDDDYYYDDDDDDDDNYFDDYFDDYDDDNNDNGENEDDEDDEDDEENEEEKDNSYTLSAKCNLQFIDIELSYKNEKPTEKKLTYKIDTRSDFYCTNVISMEDKIVIYNEYYAQNIIRDAEYYDYVYLHNDYNEYYILNTDGSLVNSGKCELPIQYIKNVDNYIYIITSTRLIESAPEDNNFQWAITKMDNSGNVIYTSEIINTYSLLQNISIDNGTLIIPGIVLNENNKEIGAIFLFDDNSGSFKEKIEFNYDECAVMPCVISPDVNGEYDIYAVVRHDYDGWSSNKKDKTNTDEGKLFIYHTNDLHKLQIK